DSTLNLYTVSKAILGFCILTFNLFFVALTLSCLCTRFMDLRQIVLSILQIGMLVTPIMWIPTESMRTKVFILEWNPIYHFVDFIRMSLLPSDFPPAVIHPSLKYIIVFTLINMMVGFIVFAKSRKNISYWV
ncbi:O92 family O-antigen export ABC transporter permease subunit, partial [Escherichia coli]